MKDHTSYSQSIYWKCLSYRHPVHAWVPIIIMASYMFRRSVPISSSAHITMPNTSRDCYVFASPEQSAAQVHNHCGWLRRTRQRHRCQLRDHCKRLRRLRRTWQGHRCQRPVPKHDHILAGPRQCNDLDDVRVAFLDLRDDLLEVVVKDPRCWTEVRRATLAARQGPASGHAQRMPCAKAIVVVEGLG